MQMLKNAKFAPVNAKTAKGDAESEGCAPLVATRPVTRLLFQKLSSTQADVILVDGAVGFVVALHAWRDGVAFVVGIALVRLRGGLETVLAGEVPAERLLAQALDVGQDGTVGRSHLAVGAVRRTEASYAVLVVSVTLRIGRTLGGVQGGRRGAGNRRRGAHGPRRRHPQKD